MPHRSLRLHGLIACAALALAACGKPGAPAGASAGPAASNTTADYIAPPELKSARHSAAGGVELRGVSRPDAQVRLLSPDGSGFSVTADRAGTWELRVPTLDPHLYALAEQAPGRLVRSRGYVALLPPPGISALVLRPGAGPGVFAVPAVRPAITAVDYDRGGAGVVSGLAAPGESVHARIDGVDAGEGRADATGAFHVSLPDVLRPGAHTVTVRDLDKTAAAPAEAHFEVGPPPAGFVPPLAAQRLDSGWRLDWRTPGGGVQTTIAFDTEPRA